MPAFANRPIWLDEEQSGLVVAPVAVVEIARDDKKGSVFLDGAFDEIGERHAGCRADPVRCGAL